MTWCNGAWKTKHIFGLHVNNELKFPELKVKGTTYIICVREITNWKDISSYNMLWRH